MKKKTSSETQDLFQDQSTRYFKTDIISVARSMPNSEMINLISDLEGTRHWAAVVKYSMERIALIMSGIYATDPIKDPSKISKYQGILTGILDLNELMLSIEEKKKEESKKKEGTPTSDEIKPY